MANRSGGAALDRWLPSQTMVLWGSAILVGLGTTAGAVGFIALIRAIETWFFIYLPQWMPNFAGGWLLLAPLLGGLLAGPLISFFAREAKGHGVPEVMQAIALRGGRIRPRVAIAKVFASALCIGSGGSAGREGPIVQVGSALGSSIGQWFHFSEERLRNLVACGAAAGIAATFNAPIAGVIFSVEIILGEMRLTDLSSVLLSAVTASTLARVILGDRPAFSIPEYTLHSPWEILLYLVLGVLAALMGIFFIKLLYAHEDRFDDWRFPDWAKPAVGGLLLGLLALGYPLLFGRGGAAALGWFPRTAEGPLMPHIYGAGFATIESALEGRLAIGLLLALALLKPLATAFTLGSGNSGGVFAPGLFSGAMLGGAFGRLMMLVFPNTVLASGPYATVGMAAVFAAAARAPLTAVLIVFEMTDDYRIILPLMATVAVSTVLAQHLHPESIYTLKLVRRGIRLVRGQVVDLLDSVRVEEIMTPNPQTIDEDADLGRLAEILRKSNRRGMPVVDAQGLLVGMVSVEDYRHALEKEPSAGANLVGSITARRPVVAFPDESVRQALARMAPRDLSRLPVVSRQNHRRLLGMLARHDIVRAYELESTRHLLLPAPNRFQAPGTQHLTLSVLPGAQAAGCTIAELALPHACVLVSVVRQGQTLIPHGDTMLMAGDQVTLIIGDIQPAQVRALFEDACA